MVVDLLQIILKSEKFISSLKQSKYKKQVEEHLCKIMFLILLQSYLFHKNSIELLIRLTLHMSSQQNSSSYNPFRYPPDYRLAKIHQEASMPGKPDRINNIKCPCCNEPTKIAFGNWWSRSIQKDFKRFGGAVVSYFWLIKLYFISSLIIIFIYGWYLHYLSDYYCRTMPEEQRKFQICSKLFGIWIVNNEDLRQQIEARGDQGTQIRFFTLRSIVFLVLLATNFMSLYVVKWFKIRHPPKLSIASFSVLFKNLKSDNIQDLLDNIKQKIGEFSFKQAFIIKKVEPFYSKYQQKLECYYQCKIEDNPKKFKNLTKKLYKLDTICGQAQQNFYNQGNRAIIVFNDLHIRQTVLENYEVNICNQLHMFFSNKYEEQYGTYTQKCPMPEQIIWNNIGIAQKQGFKVKILSIFYFLLILGFLVFVLYFALQQVYLKQIKQPYHTIVTNVILISLVAVGLTFRGWMNKLSEMRFPSTFSRRSIFIIVTTVMFHIIFYLLIPSNFLRFYPEERGDVLNLISNQSITFIFVQIILAAFDLMFCCWNRKRGMIQNQNKPIGCQKILHQKIQYPRFPLQFKLIILFKIWSFITYFAFHVPLVLFMISVALLFLYVKDKLNLYYHYRMQFIDNSVQFRFLRIYSNVFTIYLYETFVFTQHNTYQYYVGAIITIAVIVFQIIYSRKLGDQDLTDKDSFVSSSISEIDQSISYKLIYQRFLNVTRSDLVDTQIKEYLSKQGYGTMKTQESLGSQLV